MSACTYVTQSRHRSSEGVVAYQSCTTCGRRRVRLGDEQLHGASGGPCPALAAPRVCRARPVLRRRRPGRVGDRA